MRTVLRLASFTPSITRDRVHRIALPLSLPETMRAAGFIRVDGLMMWGKPNQLIYSKAEWIGRWIQNSDCYFAVIDDEDNTACMAWKANEGEQLRALARACSRGEVPTENEFGMCLPQWGRVSTYDITHRVSDWNYYPQYGTT